MKRTGLAKTVSVIGASALCVFMLAACSGSGSGGSVAATINGTDIYEDDITTYVENYRATYSMTDDDSWGEYLVSYDYTPESFRENVIDQYAQEEIVKQEIETRGITADSDEVQSYIDAMKANYSSDEAWNTALESVGTTEDEYRESIAFSLETEMLKDEVAPQEDPDEEELLTYCKLYASSYNGAKRSSQILFDASDEKLAQEVLDKITSGALTFEAAVDQYASDDAVLEAGDVGWDVLEDLADEYQDALDLLEVGQISPLVTSEYGIHIIECTDEWTAPEELTSTDQMPVEMVDSIKTLLSTYSQSSDYSTWLDDQLETAKEEGTYVINDMPEGLPYWVDMSLYEQDEETTEDEAEETGIESTVENEDGSSTITYTDGSTTTYYDDGSSRSDFTDGTYSETTAEGVTTEYDAQGNVITDTESASEEVSDTADSSSDSQTTGTTAQ